MLLFTIVGLGYVRNHGQKFGNSCPIGSFMVGEQKFKHVSLRTHKDHCLFPPSLLGLLHLMHIHIPNHTSGVSSLGDLALAFETADICAIIIIYIDKILNVKY